MIAPERLRQIRLARGYTMDQLVDRMGGIVEKQSLSNYEKGKNQPRPGVLLQLARALDVKTSALTSPSPVSVEYIGFRRKSAMTVSQEEGIKSRISFDLERRVHLQELVEPGANKRFRFDRVRVSSIEDAETAALRIRDEMGLGRDAISNVTETLERHGVHVFALDVGEKFDGISAYVRNEDGIVGAGIVDRRGVCGERQRFTRAHEAGHLFTEVVPGTGEEDVANRFAGAFLLPGETLKGDFGSSRKQLTTLELLAMKKRYGISVQALVRRLRDVGIIGEPLYKDWCIKISQRGWRKAEPEPCEPEVSSWLGQTVLRAHAEGLLTTREAEEMIGGKIGGELAALTRLRSLKKLPLLERRRILERESEAMADLYREDLQKPPQSRELTAFTALDGVDPLLDKD